MASLPLNALRTFEAVASRLSFSEGARALNVSPAAVSSQIRQLEERLNQPLFRRHGKTISLTGAGRKLLPGVQRGMGELRKAMRIVDQDRSGGVLNVSMVPTFLQKWLMPRLSDFYQGHTDIDLRINAHNELVNFGETDFHAAIRFGPGEWKGLESERILRDWIMPVCSPRLLREIGPIESAEQLQDHKLLFVESEVWDAWFRVIGNDGRDKRWPGLNDSLAILMAAEQGEGIALSRWSLVARDIAAGRLVRPINKVVRTDWSYYFVTPPAYADMPKVIAFREWILEQCKAFPPPDKG
ncbi:transcriptional regulator GcvA [Marinihelvus fidelis]|uniref:Transcriptional regulator GcvA n=1 Tax=Marinihelvus fidelis TaxID=2613842 RepID=A0A5N0TH40_9GAMM|nr:transcriptional regulator GcvA [Marinihelvus fidelis]KAA9132599.1 transcriptional regulator GcvA [Marinihelvus fidelis]